VPGGTLPKQRHPLGMGRGAGSDGKSRFAFPYLARGDPGYRRVAHSQQSSDDR
jgi:hypothetical protein